MSAAEGQSHHNVKVETTKIHKEAEHQNNVKEKHGELKEGGHHTGHPHQPYPELQHQVETGAVEVMPADGKVTGVERDHVVDHPPKQGRE